MRRVSMLALLAFACGQDPTVVTPATFERPGAIAYVCVDVATSTLVDLDDCTGVTGTTDDEMALVGLVTQTASGEVGAIDFRRRRVIDADERVPGFTFTRVGEFPSAIAVRPEEPEMTYLAAYGSRTIEWVPTGRFLGLEESEAPGEVHLPGGPTDLVLAPDAPVAYTVVPSAGIVVPLAISEVDLSISVDMAAALTPTVPADLPSPTAGAPTDYEYVCAAEGDTVGLGTPEVERVRTEIVGSGDAAEPHRLLIVDNLGGDDELLVADRQLPLIYRFAIDPMDGSLTELEPLAPGAPVRDMAVSPEVPIDDTLGMVSGTTRYLYAIDDTDQSVLVMEYDPSNAETFGKVLPVSFGLEFSDRLRLDGKATALDVIARGYDAAEPDYCATPDGDEGPLNLRGVFLAVGLATGGMQIVDVVDLDGPCRGFECAADGAEEVDQYVYIQRHRPRVANFVVAGVDTLGSPTLTVDGVGRLADSVTGEELIDGLAPVTGEAGEVACPPGQAFVFGEILCAAEDPWALGAERWTATYEGTIPRTTTLARLTARDAGFYGFTLQEGGGSFCESGVLGQNNMDLFPDEPEAGIGDSLVITTEPPENKRNDDTCREYFEPTGSDTYERRFLELPIRQAFASWLEADGFAPSVDDVALRECYPENEFVGIRVRVEQSFLVSGSRTGFLHRVTAREGDDFCIVDTVNQPIVSDDPSTYVNGRAQNGIVLDPEIDPPLTQPAPYQNPYIAFTLDAIPVNEEAVLDFTLTGAPTTFTIPVGARPGRQSVISIVQDVVYSDVDERLYVIDSNSSALVQYETEEFQVANVFE
ncbi:MAG: hypothetical protein JJ863_27445 [Deltaproteobacteria bacterium]|nr:hypothetical protein [Deltaproteobacteria bacterium]